jgi:cyclic pyranopterin phosphate synthase
MQHPLSNNYRKSLPPNQLHPPLIDNHGREITYLRLAITDRCNLRCRYCMPELGVPFIPHDELLSYEELERLVNLFARLGIKKLRITGGEPFVRARCLEFIQRLNNQGYVEQIFLTTNGVNTAQYLGHLKEIGISGINLSLDSLDRQRFQDITRRDHIDRVLTTLHKTLELNIPLKINSVVTENTSDEEIINLGNLARCHPISLRYIEEMPFGGASEVILRPENRLAERLDLLFKGIQECPSDTTSTARLFTAPDFKGMIGIIEGRSRKFCSTCNKARITPQGTLKACLYDDGVLDLRSLLRSAASDNTIINAVRNALNRRHLNGHDTEAASKRKHEPSMASIGG